MDEACFGGRFNNGDFLTEYNVNKQFEKHL